MGAFIKDRLPKGIILWSRPGAERVGWQGKSNLLPLRGGARKITTLSGSLASIEAKNMLSGSRIADRMLNRAKRFGQNRICQRKTGGEILAGQKRVKKWRKMFMVRTKKKKTEKLKSEKISDSTIRRLSIYYRTLNRMEKQGVTSTTSKGLPESEDISSAIVRKDLSHFGTFGCRGVGYDVQSLKKELANILGFNREWGLVIIGGGQFSNVLINSQTLKDNNLTIKKIFEKDPAQVKKIDGQVNVYRIDQLEEQIDLDKDHIAIITLPPPEVQAVINRLGKIGMKAVLYMASRSVNVPDNMVVMNQDISIKLGMMTYKVLENTR